ncbi:putative pentatricopeptide repeat-containing protein At3g25970 [Phoenix dactylifera]|uniref:Pentatricopeptide repeat-containing protein At3g25970 n=1 Tax=Phoenix dactylifera TaxID=42345 RepID=A0A8B7CYG9_PHODC|nr:putative pentatricopeptide repeat-containing protein At3g25970 [Phoenix dactylifera]
MDHLGDLPWHAGVSKKLDPTQRPLKRLNPECCMRSSPSLQTLALRSSAAKTHARLIKSGAASDTYAWNNVLAAYSRRSSLADARKLFDEIPKRDAVSWNALIAAHVSSGAYQQSWDLLGSMMAKGLSFDQYTLGSILKSVASAGQLEFGRQLHSLVVKSGLDSNVFSGSALVDVYAKCGRMGEAYSVFQLMPEPNTVSWNALIAGHARAGEADCAFQMFNWMEREGPMPDEATFAILLTFLDRAPFYQLMLQLHAKIVKYGRAIDAVVCNAAVTAYSQCGSIADSRKLFDSIDDNKDLVTWNSMLAAYARYGFTEHAVEIFVRMQEAGVAQDMYTFTSVISACFEHGLRGRAFHGLVIKRGLESTTPVSNALLAMYIRSCKDGLMEDAMKCFGLMEFRDSVSWNSILTGFSQSVLSEEALKFFGHMRSASLKIDHYAFSAALRSCSDLAVLQLGQQIHGLVFKSGFGSNDFVASSLIYMYSKCGVIDDARKSFDESCKDNSVTWNSIIFGYSQHGQGRMALDLFSEMQELEVAPDHITFVGIISACSHVGLVETGSIFLKSMEPIYGIPLRMEHYACGVDLFGRAGQLDAAKKLIESMPFEPDAMVWMTLLGACRIHGDMELASYAAQCLIALDPREHSTYVLLSNMFSGFGMWDDRATIQRVMRTRGLTKVPGWSWIEVKNRAHSFNAEDRSHPQAEEIYERLRDLMEQIEMASSTGSDIHHIECG